MGLIEGQVAVVTGGAGSIAQGIATKLVKEGARVFAVDADVGALDAAAKAAGASAVAADLTREGEAARVLDAIAAQAGGIDILINAGQNVTPVEVFAKKALTDLAGSLERTVMVAARAMQAVYPHLQKRGGGKIVNVGSFYGSMSNVGLADTVMADNALSGLTRVVGVEWANEKIFVNYLQPGPADIPEYRAFHARHGARADAHLAMLSIPRLADPVDDIGGGVMFLVSDEANWINGFKVYADGGQFMNAAVFNPGADLIDFQAHVPEGWNGRLPA